MKYNIIDFGAKSNGELCTKEIQDAIDKAFLSGGGEVVIPCGRFLIGCIRLRSNVTLHLMEGAALVGSIDPEDYFSYLDDEIEPICEDEKSQKVSTATPQANSQSVFPYSRWNNAVIRAIKAQNIAIIGEKNSFIDGQNCYDEQGEENYRGPHGVNMWFCENIKLSGYTIIDSGNWAHAIQNSKNVEMNKVTVLGGHDGFDIRTCGRVTVEDCEFRSGDDAIAGFDNIDVTVRNCTLNTSCSVLRFGGTNVLVENCVTVAPNEYGFRGNLSLEEKKARAQTNEKCRHSCHHAFLYYCDYRAKVRETPGNILFRNCKFSNIDSVFMEAFGHRWSCNRGLDSIEFDRCIFENVCYPITISGSEDEPLTFVMKNCVISAREGAGNEPVVEAMNFRDIIFENVTLNGYASPKIVYCTEGDISITDSTGIKLEKGEKCSRSGH
ncbi:MAG: hypothetical protein E7613_08730 [Ruminococcaceae bacterium]|nr:hypothetical protein [Oscillospiraceae bacterium]